jgi:hypothetical protein
VATNASWNDEDIPDDEVLYRYVHPNDWVANKGTGEYRLSSSFMLIEPGMDGISAYAASLLEDEGIAPAAIMRHPMHGLAHLTARDVREVGLGVLADPNDELPINFAHMLIVTPTGQFSRGQRRKLSIALIQRTVLLKPPGRDSYL